MAGTRVAPPGRTSRSRRILVVIGVVVLVVAAALVAYAMYLRQVVSSNVAQADLLPAPSAQGTQTPLDPSVSPASSPPVKLPNTGMNYLLVVSDTNAMEGGQADVIVLVHVSEAQDRISLVSFPRDLYVSVPGQGQTKMSTAYVTGGSKLLVSTVQDLLGVVVDHAAVTTFDGLARMTDALGGVDVTVTESSTAHGYTFRPGPTHMNGQMALAYIADREHPSGDTTQTQRQQAFVRALLLKAFSPATVSNPLALARFLDAASRSLTVDSGLDQGQMTSLAMGLFGVRAGDISFLTAPSTGTATRPPAGIVRLIDVPQTRALGDAVRTDRMQDYKP